MSIPSPVRKIIKKVALGKTLLPQEFTLGLREPQTEITVRLRGLVVDCDVTNHLSTACAAPLTLCIGFGKEQCPAGADLANLTLTFSPRNNPGRLLGEIGLTHTLTVPGEHSDLMFFKPSRSKNCCLSKTHIALHYLLHAYRQARRDNTQGIRMSFLERRASMVTFIRPHPILLVSVGTRENGNIFPMNLCGHLGNGYFGFALRTERVAGTIVQRAGKAALSSVPESEGYLAYRLATHHLKESIDWNQLPFSTKLSRAFQIPIPDFALRAKELEIKTSLPIGSHRFFVAQIIDEESFRDDLAFCSIHGFFQHWRLQDLRDRDRELARSLARDAVHKRERHPASS
jgi:hypothetical protein